LVFPHSHASSPSLPGTPRLKFPRQFHQSS
jgi:hypothetical protein